MDLVGTGRQGSRTLRAELLGIKYLEAASLRGVKKRKEKKKNYGRVESFVPPGSS